MCIYAAYAGGPVKRPPPRTPDRARDRKTLVIFRAPINPSRVRALIPVPSYTSMRFEVPRIRMRPFSHVVPSKRVFSERFFIY